jgi:hypothetical protein
MMQEIIVAVVVLCASVAVFRRYAPKSWRQLARIGAVRLATALPMPALASKIAQQAEAGASCGDGCGSCGNCSTGAPLKSSATGAISVEALKRTIPH